MGINPVARMATAITRVITLCGCILLDLIDLTPMHVGIDFNSPLLTTAIRLAAAARRHSCRGPMKSVPPRGRGRVKTPKSHQRGVGGWFRSSLQRDRLQKFRNSTEEAV